MPDLEPQGEGPSLPTVESRGASSRTEIFPSESQHTTEPVASTLTTASSRPGLQEWETGDSVYLL